MDHIAATYREVIAETRAVAPDAGPAPADEAAVYEWMAASTTHLSAEQQLARDAMVLKQSLKHAIALGDVAVLRRVSCPRCACWSLFWRKEDRRVACFNRRCRDRHGLPSTWVLQQLALHQVTMKAARSRAAT
ncbi:hypothetical protein ACH4GZ_38795 [Streptomyces hygroscopicus]|uniref:hypothetical protein n=1 Tax=Streptomyces hygroscopicus TaxID=1912 RepID=UPI0037B8CCC7